MDRNTNRRNERNRNINRISERRRRQRNRMRARINNVATLRRIANLPQQNLPPQNINDSFMLQLFFNGSNFY
jgi:hypothetical protein